MAKGDFTSEADKPLSLDARRWDPPGPRHRKQLGWYLGSQGGGVVCRNGRGGLCAAVRAGEARGGRGGLGGGRAEGSFLPTGEEKQMYFSAFERKGVHFF